MAEHHIYEKQDINLKATLKRGQPRAGNVEFVLSKDGVEFKREKGTISKAGDIATATHKTDDVAPDKEKFKIEYYAIVDGDRYDNSDVVWVWPRKVKVI